jgi:hypothetical protein
MIIISTADTYEVGRVVNVKLWDGNGDLHRMPVRVVRQATEDEWLTFARSTGASEEDIKDTLWLTKNFYEIQVD